MEPILQILTETRFISDNILHSTLILLFEEEFLITQNTASNIAFTHVNIKGAL